MSDHFSLHESSESGGFSESGVQFTVEFSESGEFGESGEFDGSGEFDESGEFSKCGESSVSGECMGL